jgi:endonuclease YncB( thermonuclease family)
MLHLAFTSPKDTDGDGLFDKHGGTGRAVWVRTDPSQDTYDRYQRLLAYVTTRSRPKNLALEQIRAGLGKAYVYERRFAQYSRFKSSERTARQRDRGVWGDCGGDFHSAQ